MERKTSKRILGLILTLALVFSLFVGVSTHSLAGTNGYTRESAASWMLNTVLGHGWNVDGGGAGYDCKDLALKYFEDVGGLSTYQLGNAYIYADYATLPSGWTRKYYSNGYRPQKGDMACWGTEFGSGDGHVALIYDVDDTYIYVVEQSSNKNVPAYKGKYKITSPKCYVVPDFTTIPPEISVAEGVYTIQNVRNPSKVLDIQYNSKEVGANIQLYDYVGTTVQKFKVVKNGDGYSLQSVYNGLWLDTALPANTDGCNIQLWFSNTEPEQKWHFLDADNGNVFICSDYDVFVDTDHGATDNSTNVETFHYDGTTSQQWKLIKTSASDSLNITEGTYIIRNVRDSSKVMDIMWNSTEVGANIQVYDDVGETVQQFRIIKSGYFYNIQSVYNGLWLDTALPANTEGCNIQLWFSNTNPEQKWTFEDAGNGNVYIRSGYGVYIDTDKGATTNGTNVETFTFDGTTSQQWKLVRIYSVKFNGNGATSGSMNNQTFSYDVAQNLTANAFQRKYTVTYNYNGATGGNSASTATAAATFNGWATSASGVKVYSDKQSVKNLTTSGTYNLYANWTLGTITLPTPTKTGYTFAGWNTKADGSGTNYSAGANFKPSSGITLYAQWSTCSHTWNSGSITKSATCTAAGEKTYTCTACGETKTETISALGHNFGSWTKLDDTQHQRVCSRDSSHVEKANHTWNSGSITTQPTCTKTGVKTYTCTACKATKTESVAATGHTSDNGTITTAPTCTQTGVKTYKCTVCGTTIKTETVAAKGHTSQSVAAVPATCTTKGRTAGTKCSVCGVTLSGMTETSALGHDYGSWTKLNDTQHQRVCSRDSSHVEKANHTWNSGTVTTQPTCTNVGIKTYTCTACSATKTETVAAKGHTSQSVSAVAATCTEKGKTAGTKCSVCGVTLSGLAEGHDYKATVTTQPTCTTEGVKTYKCSRCTSSYTEKISATGHTQETRNAVAPTCTQEGYTGDVYCKVCDELLEEGISIPKAAHEFVDGVCLNCGAEDPDFDAPSIESAEGSDIVVDKDNAIIYGFSDTPYCEDDILNNFEVVGTGVTAEIVPTENGYGTGTIINLIVNDEIVDSYTIIIFGDATGDGIIDESDFVMIDLYNAMLYFPEEDSPEFLGMDCNRDGVVDESDIVLVDLVNAFMGEIDQINGGIIFY